MQREKLVELGLYFNRPAIELIFLKESEHISLHNKGKHCSEETKRKLSDANKGKHLSEETKRKLSAAQKGIPKSEEHKRKISDANKGKKNHMYGKHHSDETRRKISVSQKGKKRPEITGKKNGKSKQVYQIDKNTGEIIRIWPCTMEVKRQLGINHGHISQCCLERRKSAGGFVWRYANSCTPPYRRKPLF